MLIPQEKFFEGLGFENMPDLGCNGCHKGTDGCYYHVDHFSRSYVIEVADTEEHARLNCFEDAYLFDDSLSAETIIRQVRDTLVKMCRGEKITHVDKVSEDGTNDTLSREQVAWIISQVYEVAYEAAQESRADRKDLFAEGRALGLYEAVDIIKNRLIICGIDDLSLYGMDIDLDKELL